MEAGICVNHAGRSAAARCRGCDRGFCNECLPYLVNAEPWCSVCANRVIGASRPRYVRGAVVLGAAWFVLTILWFMLEGATGRIWPTFMAISYAATALFAWNQASPLRGTERPRVERR